MWVSNAPEKIFPPVGDGLFNLYGGLYRTVQLIKAPRISLSRQYRGGPGVRVWSQKVSEKEADVQVQAMIDGDAPNLTVTAELADAAGKVVATGRRGAARGFGYPQGQSPELSSPEQLPLALAIRLADVQSPALWSPEHPTLYTLTVRLLQDGHEIDRATVRHGFRWYQFTADRGFFLNGHPYKLHGVNRHQDFLGEGNALSVQQHYDDIRRP